MNDKKLGALYGALVGDACGCPYEFKAPENIPAFDDIDMIPPPGYKRSWNKIPVGTYTDDGAQVLCLLETLQAGTANLPESLRIKLIAWLGGGHMSVDNVTFDSGNQTKQALLFCHSVEEVKAKLSDERSSGNGSLMRCIPVALVATSLDEAIQLAATQSLPTHPNTRCQLTCSIYAGVAYEMLQGKEVDAVIDGVIERIGQLRPDDKKELDFISDAELDEETGSGYVVDCLWSALHALRLSRSYEATIKNAIALGNDTDTTACVAGGLAGIKYGYSGIPRRWLDLLRGKHLIEPIAAKLG